MASVEEENLGRRTRSSRKNAAAAPPLPSPARSTRRSSKRQTQEQFTEHEHVPDIPEEELETHREVKQYEDKKESNQMDIIKEMLAEAAQGVISGDHCNVLYEDHQLIETVEEVIEEVPQDDNYVVYEEQLVTDDDNQLQIEHDVEMYTVTKEEQANTEVPVVSEATMDEKSSSFPFGTVVQSETSEDAQNEEEEEGEADTTLNQNNAVESSLLASIVGDNANSLPSVGGGEDLEVKRVEEFEEKAVESVAKICEKMESDDSLSEPAIAEDIAGAGDASDATIVNTEMVSEDELPLPTKPAINDAEEVSDDELPAPKRAELPADAEVISEDELPTPTAASAEKKLPLSSPKHKNKSNTQVEDTTKKANKRKAEDSYKNEELSSSEKHKKSENTKKKNDEQYNPMSPTSEGNETPPIEKKIKFTTENYNLESDHKERKKEKERERDRSDREKDREREKDKEKDRDKDKENEKERKRLPDLDKYWRTVKDDPADFTGWTYLLQYVDNESNAEAAREAYDAFLSHYPYCYGYWRKYADYEKHKGIKINCNAVFERGLEAIPLSVDLWIHYLTHVKTNHPDDEDYIRNQFERAIEACGLEFRSDKLWDAYIKWENDGKQYSRVLSIYDRLLTIPTQGYSGHFDNFQDLINQHSITSTISADELKKLRIELRESSSSRSSSSRSSKSRRASSKEHERDRDRDSHTSNHEEVIENVDDINTNEIHDTERSSEKTTTTSDISDSSTLCEEDASAIKDKVISIRRKLHKTTVAAVTSRWTYEEGIKRPYFHVKPLERCQLKNWKDYLDYEIENGDRKRVLVLFERCLIACALYDEFWLKMIRYLETQLDQPDIPAITSDVYRRACQIHHPDKPSLHLMWAAFEECQNNFDNAAEVLVNLEQKCPNLLQVAYRRINVERRRGDLGKCCSLYEHYITNAKNKTIAGSLSIKYARFLNKINNDLDGGLRVLRQALEKDSANTRVALQMIDLALQRPKVDEDEVVLIMEKFMVRENIDPEQKVLFAQRKVEFLEDFGSTAKGLQDAQRALQLALNKANEAKKKRESSPSRKLSSNNTKDVGSSNSTNNSAVQAAYNNGSAAANSGYNYNSSNATSYYGAQNSGVSAGAYQQQSYDGYYNHWQYGSGYSGYGQWSGYGNYY